MLHRGEIENSMVRESFHDPRYDEPDYYDEEFEDEDEEIPERLYADGEFVIYNGIKCKVISGEWNTEYDPMWKYRIEDMTTSENITRRIDAYEDELERSE